MAHSLFHKLYRFSGIEFAFGGLTVDAAGVIYGTTSGIPRENQTIFQIKPDGSEQTLYTFEKETLAYGVIMDEAGNLYGENYTWPGAVFELVK